MKKYLPLLLVITILYVPLVADAQRYLVDLPIDTKGSFDEYINLLYKMSISIAALLAVVKIIIAGAKYMLSDVINTKGDAKKDIQGALLGLLLIMGAVIILNTINPALSDGGLNIRKIVVPPLSITPAPVAVPPAGPTANPATTPAPSATLNPTTPPATGGGASPVTPPTTIPPLNCLKSSSLMNGLYQITVYDLRSCNKTYRFVDQANKTAYQISLDNARAVCLASVSSKNSSWKGQFTSSGTADIYECRLYNP